MRVTRIEAIPVRVPLKAGMVTKTAHGDHHTSDYVIVRVHTDAGIVGLGEATVSALWSGETSKSCVAAIHDLIGPALVGSDPTRITAIAEADGLPDQAQPVHQGGRRDGALGHHGKGPGRPGLPAPGRKLHDIIPTKMMIGAFDLPRVRSLAEQFLGWGIRCLKVKVGIDLAGDVARVPAVRELAGPGYPDHHRRQLRLERHHGAHRNRTAPPVQRARRRAADRARRHRIDGLFADGRRHPDHGRRERVHARRRLERAPGPRGRRDQRVSRQERRHRRVDRDRPGRQAAGITCHVGSNLELGIGSAAMLHLAAAVPNIDSATYPADILGPHYHEADLLTEPLDLKPDGARVPDGPGLGVELDEEQLSRFRVL